MISKFVTLTDYCVLEYMMTPLGDPAPEVVNSQYYFVDNKHVDGYQLYNTDAYTSITKNTRGLSVVAIGGSRLVRVDLTDIPIYTQYDPNITETAVSASLSSFTIMDTMRFHFASGFNFTEVENIILGARQKLNDLKQLQLANVLVDAQTAQTLLTFNPKPLYLTNTIYDRYVDVKIPTLSYLNEDFNQFGSASFEYAITNGTGFIKEAPITVSLIEATYEDYYPENGEKYELYRVANYFEGSVPQINEFDSLGAVIQEATDGDYIEFFATWNGTFAEDLISTLNAKGPDNDWIFIHQLQVYEQVGTALVPSGNFMVYQEDNFDTALSYRPILKEAGFAVSMSIDYTLRLLNKKTGDQIIRTGSMSLFNPNKYGKYLAKLELADRPQSMKVYNKIVQKNLEISNLFTGGKAPQAATAQMTTAPTVIEKEVKVGVPVFYKQSNIQISQKNALLKYGDGSMEVIYGQGEMILPIDPTDNFFKINVYEKNPVNPKVHTPANLNNNSTFTLTFGSDSKFVYNGLTDPAYVDPSKGQLSFRIPKDQAKKILESTDTTLFISLVGADGTETLLYTGRWLPSSQYSAILRANEAAQNALLNDPQEIISELREKITNLESTNAALTRRLSTSRSIFESPRPGAIRFDTIQSINPIASVLPPSSELFIVNVDTEVTNLTTFVQDTPLPTTTRKSQDWKNRNPNAGGGPRR